VEQREPFYRLDGCGIEREGIKEASRRGAYCAAKDTFLICGHFGAEAAIKTLWLALEEMDLMYLPVRHTWRMNERHYGALQGLNKLEMVDRFGPEQVHQWRRSYDIRRPHSVPTMNAHLRRILAMPRCPRGNPLDGVSQGHRGARPPVLARHHRTRSPEGQRSSLHRTATACAPW